MPIADREAFLGTFGDEELYSMYHSWWFWARPNQMPPSEDDEWFVWLALAGRGWGKTRAGGGWFHDRMMAGDERRDGALIAQTPGDARDDMIEGPGGILRNAPPWQKPDYQPSKRRIVWSTGAYATIYSGANPEQIRGFSGDTAWCDELAAWQYPRETWDNLIFGMREAKLENPRICITTTPKPIALVRQLVQDPMVRISGGSSYENYENLSPLYYKAVIAQHEGTRLGQQEIYARVLDEDPRALWKRHYFDSRVLAPPPAADILSIVVAVDPPGKSDGEDAAEAGIAVVAKAICRCNDGKPETHGFVLADLSGRMTPLEWGSTVVRAYHDWKANYVVAETNFGGEMVEHTIRTAPRGANVPYKPVNAARGKDVRAEPVAAKYEKGTFHHVGVLELMEDEMCTYVKGETKESPNRLDAAVHGSNFLFPTDDVPKLVTFGD
jgi:phage terminase large subunit-like protein